MSEQTSNSLRFLAGSGPGERLLLREFHDCSIGRPENWRPELKTAVSIMLNCDFPAFITWGEDLCLLYNDSCIEMLSSKHPNAFGRPVAEVWEEVSQSIRSVFEKPMHARAGSQENASFTIHQRGINENTEPVFASTPIYLGTGEVGGVYCSSSRPVSKLPAEKSADEEIKGLYQLVEQAPGFFAIVTGSEHVFEFANNAYKQLVGRDDLIGKPVRNALPELADQGSFQILDNVYASGEPFFGKRMPVKFHSTKGNKLEKHFVELVFQPFFYPGRTTRGIFIQGHDVTEHKRAEDELRSSQQRALEAMRAAETERRRLDALLEAAPVGIAMVDAEGAYRPHQQGEQENLGRLPSEKEYGRACAAQGLVE